MDIKELKAKVEELEAEVIRLRKLLKESDEALLRSKYSSLYED